MQNISSEIRFKTARSGGKGGQNVNKVETMVEGYWNVATSRLFTPVEKEIITEKLAAKINAEGALVVKSQQDRTQLGNKEIVTRKMNLLIANSLKIRKARRKTRPTISSVESRISRKKQTAIVKQTRRKPARNSYYDD